MIKTLLSQDADRLLIRGAGAVRLLWPAIAAMGLAGIGLACFEIYAVWQNFRADALADLDNTLRSFGEQYVLNVLDTTDLSIFDYTWPDRDLSFAEFLDYARQDPTLRGQVTPWVMLGILSLCLTSVAAVLAIRNRGPVPLVFDRRLQVIHQGQGESLHAAPWHGGPDRIDRLGPVWILSRPDGRKAEVRVSLTNSPRFAPTPGMISELTEQIAAFMAGQNVDDAAPVSDRQLASLPGEDELLHCLSSGSSSKR